MNDPNEDALKCPKCGRPDYQIDKGCLNCGFVVAETHDETPATGRPFRVGGVLGRGFSIFFRNILSFGILALIFTGITHGLQWFVLGEIPVSGAYQPQAGNLLGLPAKVGTLTFVNMFITNVMTAALVYGTVQDLNGQRAPISACLARGIQLIFPIFGVAFLMTLFIMLGMILLIIPGIIVMMMFWVAIPVAVIERPGVMASLRRSRELTKGSRWRIFGILLILIILFVIPQSLASWAGDLQTFMIFQFLLSAFFAGLYAVIIAVAYHDLRVAKEGINIAALAAVFD